MSCLKIRLVLFFFLLGSVASNASAPKVWFSGITPVGSARENHIDSYWKVFDDSLKSRLLNQKAYEIQIGKRHDCLSDSQKNRNPEDCQLDQARGAGANWVITARIQEEKSGILEAKVYLRLVLADEWIDSGTGRGSRKEVVSYLAGISSSFSRTLNAQAPMELDTFSLAVDEEIPVEDTLAFTTKPLVTQNPIQNSKVGSLKDKNSVNKKNRLSKSSDKQKANDRVQNTWISIPAGCFPMGSPDTLGSEDERPQHEVCLSEFRIQKNEVSQSEFETQLKIRPWEECRGVTCTPGNPKHPAWYVTWTEANEYCSKIGARLPTEAEYEYVARAGQGTIYAWGDSTWQACEYANIADNSLRQEFPKWVTFPCQDGYPRIAVVGSRRPNAWGIHDLTGNVWEWTADWYSAEYYRIAPKQDPKGPAVGTGKVMRGGSWLSGPSGARVAYRDGFPPHKRYSGATGFRCVVIDP